MLVDLRLFQCDAFTPLLWSVLPVKTRTVAGGGSAAGLPLEPVQIAAVGSRAVAESTLAVQVRPEPPSHLIAGLSQLLCAFDYATDVGRDVWDFAIEIAELRSAGMSTSDFRWLVSKGFVQHAQETSLYGAPHRCFRRGDGLTFLTTSALVLTSRGAYELRKLLAAAAQSDRLPADAQTAVAMRLPIAERGSPQLLRDLFQRLPNDGQTPAAPLY